MSSFKVFCIALIFHTIIQRNSYFYLVWYRKLLFFDLKFIIILPYVHASSIYKIISDLSVVQIYGVLMIMQPKLRHAHLKHRYLLVLQTLLRRNIQISNFGI